MLKVDILAILTRDGDCAENRHFDFHNLHSVTLRFKVKVKVNPAAITACSRGRSKRMLRRCGVTLSQAGKNVENRHFCLVILFGVR